jgi:hypothetical protein
VKPLSAAHILYIPLCLLVGAVLGWWLGSRSSQGELERHRALLEEARAKEAETRLALSGAASSKPIDPGGAPSGRGAP